MGRIKAKIAALILIMIFVHFEAVSATNLEKLDLTNSVYNIKEVNNTVEVLKGNKVIAKLLPPVLLNNVNLSNYKNEKSLKFVSEIPIIENGYVQWKIEKSEPSDVVISSEGNNKVLKIDFHAIKTSFVLTSPFVKLQDNVQVLSLAFDYKIDTKPNSHLKQDEYFVVAINLLNQDKAKILSYNEKVKITPGWSTFKTSLSLPLDTKYINLEIFQNGLRLSSVSFKNFRITYSRTAELPFKLTRVEKYKTYIEQEFENEYQRVIRKVFISSSQDIINVEEKLISKVDHQVFKEYSPISFDTKPLSILRRDYSLTKLNYPMYTTDTLSDFYLKLEDAAIGYANNYDSIETYNLKNRADVYLFLSNADDVKFFLIGKNREHIYTLTQLFKKGFEKTYTYSIFPESFFYAIKSRAPTGTKGILIFSHHSDSNMITLIKAMMFGTTDTKDKSYMKKGFIGYGIPITWGFFYKSVKGINGFDNPEYRKIIEDMKQKGIEVVLHTASPIAKENTPQLIEKALQDTSYLKIDNWIDHSLSDGTRCADLKSEGALKNSKNYSFNIFLKYGYKYCWSYLDVKLDDLNMLEPDQPNVHPQIFFKNFNFGEGDSLYQWNSVRYKNLLEVLTKSKLEKFVQQNGVSIIHDYFAHPMQRNKFFYSRNKNVYLTPQFDQALKLVRDFKEKKLLWVPTVKEFIDYELALKNITITPFDGKTILIENKNNFEIKGFTLLPIANNPTKHTSAIVLNLVSGINIVTLL